MTTWPLLDSIREKLGDSLYPEKIAPIISRPPESLRILRQAAEEVQDESSLSPPVGVVRPYVGRHPGTVIRAAWSDMHRQVLPFESYLSEICGKLILFPEIVINDPVIGIFEECSEEWSEAHLTSIAPALLHTISVLEPLFDRGYVHVISLRGQDQIKARRAVYEALYKAAYGDGATFGGQRRGLQSLGDEIVVATLFSSQLQVYFTPAGLSLYEQALGRRDQLLAMRTLLAPPRVRLRVPHPEHVSISDILRIRETGQLDRWMLELNQSVEACTQMLTNDVSDNELAALVQDRLLRRQQDLWHTAEHLGLRSSLRSGAQEIAIGLMASLPGLYWSPEVYAQMSAANIGLSVLNTARRIVGNRGKQTTDLPMLHHYEAFFTNT